MSIAEELKAEGEKEVLLDLLQHATPEIRSRFLARVTETSNLSLLRELRAQILSGTRLREL